MHLYTVRIFLSILLLFMASFVFGQKDVVVQLTLIDKKDGEAIRNAKVELSKADSSFSLRTNHLGKVQLKSARGVDWSVAINHPRYLSSNEKLKVPSLVKDDTLRFTWNLEAIRVQNIEEMVVAAPGVPVTVFESKQLHVSDYEILQNGNLLLLTYPKQLKKGSRLILFDGRNILSNFEISERSESLMRDFRGNAHLICEDNVYGVFAEDKKVGLLSLEKDYFFKYIAPILDTNKSKLYFSNFNSLYPAFDYFAYDRMDSTYTKIMKIEDELMMELYRSEYKWVDVRTKLWAKNKEIETGVDAEIWVGMNYFTQSIYYKELYAPMFHRNDSLFVFDYYKDQLMTFDDLGNVIDSVPIYHHYKPKQTGWSKNVIQDHVTGQIYAVFDRAGYSYIGWIDTETGEIKEQVKLEYRYAENIQVYNNQVYYIYRPFESIQKKYLYKERLPYDFGMAHVSLAED